MVDTVMEQETSRFAVLRDNGKELRIHYHDCGEGSQVVVLLHGSGPGASGWANFNRNVGPLVDAGFRVVLMDCPGWGKSDPIICEESRSDLNARVLYQLLDHLAIPAVHIIGNSMGGHSAVVFALRYPQSTQRLVLMGGGTGGLSLFTPMPAEGIKLLQSVYRDPCLENVKKMMAVFVFNPETITDDLLQARLANMLANKTHLHNFTESLTRYPAQFPDVGPRLGEVVAPTLVIWGRQDRFVPMDIGLRLVAGMPNSELHLFNRCGHWVQWEHASAFNHMVIEFLLRQEG